MNLESLKVYLTDNNPEKIGFRSYFFLWLNSVAAILIFQYMHSASYLITSFIPSAFSALAYYYGYQYSYKNNAISKWVFLLFMIVYIGVFSIPAMSRFIWLNFHAAMFANELGRLIAFRAFWLTSRREAYLHLFLYLLPLIAALGHYRADASILIFVPFNMLLLYLGLYSLYRDGRSNNTKLSFISSLQCIAAIFVFFITLASVLPHTQLWDFQVVPEKHRFYKKGEKSGEEKTITTQSLQNLQRLNEANPDSKLNQMTSEFLSKVNALLQEVKRIPFNPLIFLLAVFLALLLTVLAYYLYIKRHRIAIAIQAKYIDPIRLMVLIKKKNYTKRDLQLLFQAYDRLWDFKGVPRPKTMAPQEHLYEVAKKEKPMATDSLKIINCFQSVVYGQNNLEHLKDELESYVKIRSTIHPNVQCLFE